MNAAEALATRVEALRREPAWAHYERAREHVLAMFDSTGAQPSEYWREELAELEYLLDASPLVVNALRRHTGHVTGLHAYDYRSGRSAAPFVAKLAALAEAAGGDALFVPESPALGGFGHRLDAGLANLDTLKFFEALIALDRASLLPRRGERALVWEIGAGWGGFARALKTVRPDVTYVIVDLPELLLLSGTYLPTVLPDARVRFWAGEDHETLFAGWEQLDVIYVPAGALAAVRPPRLDLALNMISFQEMTEAQVAAYVDRAAELGAPLYSFNRDRSPHNRELGSVRDVIARRYALEELEILDVPYWHVPARRRAPRARALAAQAYRRLAPERAGVTGLYRHVVGRHPACEPVSG